MGVGGGSDRVCGGDLGMTVGLLGVGPPVKAVCGGCSVVRSPSTSSTPTTRGCGAPTTEKGIRASGVQVMTYHTDRGGCGWCTLVGQPFYNPCGSSTGDRHRLRNGLRNTPC